MAEANSSVFSFWLPSATKQSIFRLINAGVAINCGIPERPVLQAFDCQKLITLRKKLSEPRLCICKRQELRVTKQPSPFAYCITVFSSLPDNCEKLGLLRIFVTKKLLLEPTRCCISKINPRISNTL